jgi:hypothetical protein
VPVTAGASADVVNIAQVFVRFRPTIPQCKLEASMSKAVAKASKKRTKPPRFAGMTLDQMVALVRATPDPHRRARGAKIWRVVAADTLWRKTNR